jgi:hypothetical protein
MRGKRAEVPIALPGDSNGEGGEAIASQPVRAKRNKLSIDNF